MDESFGIALEISGDESLETELLPLSKKRKRVPRTESTIFKKTLWPQDCSNKHFQTLQHYRATIATQAIVTTAYFIPTALLHQLKLLPTLTDALTAQPKSKKFQQKETRHPWPLVHDRTPWTVIPRPIGVTLFGLPRQVRIHAGLPISLPAPVLPLLTAETAVVCNGIDQTTAVAAIETYLKETAATQGFAGCLFCISPGYGKTCCAAHLIQRLGRKALFIVPNVPFIDQVREEMIKVLGPTVRVGVLATSDTKKWDVRDKDIVIAMGKSVANIAYDLSDFGTVVVDECHEMCTANYAQMFYRFGAQYVLGLTATPERADHCGAYLEWLVGPVIWYEQRDITKLRWGGVIVTIYDVRYEFPIKEILLKSKDPFWEGMTRQLIHKDVRIRFMINHVIVPRFQQGRRLLILGTRIEAMEELHATLTLKYQLAAGILVGTHSNGRIPSATERKEAQKQPILIASIAIVCKALNIPALDTIIVLSGGSYVNETFWTQLQGRITRDHATKQDPEIVLIRDCYKASIHPADGVFAQCVDAACKTLFKQSPTGFKFRSQQIFLHEGTKSIQAQTMEEFTMV